MQHNSFLVHFRKHFNFNKILNNMIVLQKMIEFKLLLNFIDDLKVVCIFDKAVRYVFAHSCCPVCICKIIKDF